MVIAINNCTVVPAAGCVHCARMPSSGVLFCFDGQASESFHTQ